jgi:hypothetical protein
VLLYESDGAPEDRMPGVVGFVIQRMPNEAEMRAAPIAKVQCVHVSAS